MIHQLATCKRVFLFLLFIYGLKSFAQTPYTYPITVKGDVIDTIWNRPVADPYRWLEDIDSEQTKAWIAGQTLIREKYSSKLSSSIADHLTNYSYIRSKNISKQGHFYFSYRINALSESASLYYQVNLDDNARLLFDPNQLEKSSVTSIDGIALSEDEKTLALILSRNGSDWKTIRFISMDNGKLFPDSINFVKYSPVYWSGNSIFYIKYDVKDVSESFSGLIKIKALQCHKLGTSQDEDLIVYTPESMTDAFGFEVTPGKQHLILSRKKKHNGKTIRFVFQKRLPYNKEEEFKLIIKSDVPGVYFNVIGEVNNKLLVASNLNAKNGVLYKCDPEKLNSFERIGQHYTEQLESAAIINDNKIIVLYNGDKRSYAIVNDSLGNKLNSWRIPEGTSFTGLTYARGDSVLIYYINSFFNPSTGSQINLNTFEEVSLMETTVPFSFSDLTTEKVYYHSKDSTLIPMYLTHRKQLKPNGNVPTILYGYGGFGISTKPFFDANNIAFLNSGGMLAVPQLRGGGDFPGWHEQGQRLNKQNTFDDFIAAAEYLISKKYTKPEKLAIMGGSNGGLLVGACMTQRPELFKVAVSKAGVLDMLRYHLYNIGYRYDEEYGSIKDSLDFENLIRYSPVSNVKSGIEYPATLLVASDNDDRVNPFHSFKFLSQLQTLGSGKNPYILYFQENAGHSGSRIFEEQIKTRAFIYSFIYKYLGIENKIYFED